MSLEELAQIKYASSLTNADYRDLPSNITIITSEQIRMSGARDIDELLEIFVPNLQVIPRASGVQSLGLRGVTAGLDNGFLYLVNGKVMNDRTAYGAKAERFMALLGDIKHLEIVRGSGSSIYGPGAVAGIINIVTYDGSNFNGFDVKVRLGAFEEFTAVEMRLGHDFSEKTNLFLYYGIDKYEGAKAKYSPVTADRDSITWGEFGKEIKKGVVRDNQAFRDKPRHKLYAQLTIEDLSLSLRYTKSGNDMFSPLVESNSSLEGRTWGLGFQQLTLRAHYLKKINQDFELDFSLSQQFTDVDVPRPSLVTDRKAAFSYLTSETSARLQLNWNVNDNHQLALGFEYSYFLFNRRGLGWPDEQQNIVGITEPWEVGMGGIFMAYQWAINDYFTVIIDGRADKHRFTDPMYSPRLAVIYKPNDANTFKAIFNRSVRRGDEFELKRAESQEGADSGNTEEINVFDLIWESQINDSWRGKISSFYYQHDILRYNFTTDSHIPLGQTEAVGIEFEFYYKRERLNLSLSHSYTNLLDFRLDQPFTTNLISAEPYGFGSNYLDSSPHISKFRVDYKINERFSISSSLRIFWELPGMEDADDNLRTLEPNILVNDEQYDMTAFLNMGLQYKASDNFDFRFDAFNILGWIDRDYNRRQGTTGSHRTDAAALALSIMYTF